MSQGIHKVTPNGDPFTDCLAATLEWEGGKFNHPKDPGGKTMQGVIQKRYDQYRKAKGLPLRDVYLLERHELLEIYKTYYWDVMECSKLPPGVDLVVFDFGVNSGPARAVKYAKWLKDDDPDTFVRRFMIEREAFLRSLRTFRYFGKGWINRTQDIRRKALARVKLAPPKAAPTGASAKAQPGFFASLFR